MNKLSNLKTYEVMVENFWVGECFLWLVAAESEEQAREYFYRYHGDRGYEIQYIYPFSEHYIHTVEDVLKKEQKRNG